jgi:hypothetical protein
MVKIYQTRKCGVQDANQTFATLYQMTMTRFRRLLVVAVPAALAAAALVPSSDRIAVGAPVPAPTPAGTKPPVDYNRDVRPILSENCYYCHGQDPNHRKADLRLDVRAVAVKAEAIVPGQPDKSGLVARIFTDDADDLMPPANSHRQLSAAQKDTLKRWVAEGAAYQPHWAFATPVRPALPPVKHPAWVRNPIDAFVLARLEQEGLEPSAEADRTTLLRRVTLDLTGLPPAPADVDAFLVDQSPDAYEKVVDRLLASPAYGERMALPWLDAARYADSNGFQQDGDTYQWIWRDWVVKALNADMPFDRFSIEQLAGDLLSKPSVDQKIATGFNRNHLLNGEGGAIAEEQRFNVLFDRVDTTATTWLGLTVACAQCHDHKYDPIKQTDYYSLMAAFNQLPEKGTPDLGGGSRIRVATPVLELPTAENKAEVARLEAALKKAETDGDTKKKFEAALAKWEPTVTPDNVPGFDRNAFQALRTPEAERTPEERKKVKASLRAYFEKTVWPPIAAKDANAKRAGALAKEIAKYKNEEIARVMVMEDSRPRDTFVLERGVYEKPTATKVVAGPPEFLPPMPADAPKNRLGIARWLFAPENPLTARVAVNRYWQTFFGTGLVKTSEDLGVQSEPPVHRDLIDWLAVEFREPTVDERTVNVKSVNEKSVSDRTVVERTVVDGNERPGHDASASSPDVPPSDSSAPTPWGVKRMHRLIVTSATYRQSSRVTPSLLTRDPENRLMARGSRFRLPSTLLRDVALSAAGLLDGRVGGKPVYPYQPDGIWDALAITKERDFTYPKSEGADLYRRSLYTFWRRTVGPANLFDGSNRQTCRVRSAVNNTPLHALTTLNDPTWAEAARVLAAKAIAAGDEPDARMAFAFRRVVGRDAKPAERATLRRMLERQRAIYAADPKAAAAATTVGAAPRADGLDVTEHAALSAVCLGILNLDEALTRE